MGKSNEEIRKIKDGFKDAKYDNSLEKAVRNELVANKFRMAVLIQLEGVRMEELGHGMRFDMDEIREDVRRLGEILERRDGRGGGETVMIEIIVNRSDGWIKEIAIMYRNQHGRDLPKAIMNHSKNLVVSNPRGRGRQKEIRVITNITLFCRAKRSSTSLTAQSTSPSAMPSSLNKLFVR